MTLKKLIKLHLGEEAKIRSTLFGGMMNQSYIIDCENKQYVLYMPTAQANEMVDRKLEKETLEISYNLHIAPQNIYFDLNLGYKINEYIPGSSLDKINTFDYKEIATLLNTLHSSQILATKDYRPFERFTKYEEEALFFIKEYSEQYSTIREMLFNNKDYLEKQKKTLSHNDAQRSNIILSEEGKYLLIDFEFAANNDPIYDFSAFGNNSIDEGLLLLETAFPNPSYDIYKRFYLWRIYLSLQWYNVALIKHYRHEGITHQIDFLAVSKHFLDNATRALERFLNIKKDD